MYKLINKQNLDVFQPMNTVFKNRGLSEEDAAWFLKPTPYELDANLLENLQKGIDCLFEHIEKKSKIQVIIDNDLDGASSSAVLISYLRKALDVEPIFSFHTEKKHGIEIDHIEEGVGLILAPDSLSNEFEIYKELADRGIDIILLDHHDSEYETKDAIVINPKLSPRYDNEELSGAGVVFKFIQQIDKRLGISLADYFLDVAAFGMTGDGMKVSSKESYWMIHKGINNIKNEFLKELIKKNLDPDVKLSPQVLSFKLIPQINGMLRAGTLEEKMELFQALLGHKELIENPRLRRPNKFENYGERVARLCRNAYTRQAKLRDKIVEELKVKVDAQDLTKNQFIVLELDSIEENYTGYIASRVVSTYRKPVIILRENDKEEGFKTGSLRGYDPLLKSTKDFLNGLGVFESCGGHQQAAGVKISLKNIEILNETINEALKHIEIDSTYEVDLILPAKSITNSFVTEMEKYSRIFGKGLEAPSIAVEGIEVNLGDSIIMGKEENMIKFVSNQISFLKFNDADELIKLRSQNKTAILNVVGRTGINSYRGNTEPQFVIEAYEIVEVKDTARFVF